MIWTHEIRCWLYLGDHDHEISWVCLKHLRNVSPSAFRSLRQAAGSNWDPTPARPNPSEDLRPGMAMPFLFRSGKMEGSISVRRFCLEGLSWKGKRILLSFFILQHCNTGQFILHLHRSLCGSWPKLMTIWLSHPLGIWLQSCNRRRLGIALESPSPHGPSESDCAPNPGCRLLFQTWLKGYKRQKKSRCIQRTKETYLKRGVVLGLNLNDVVVERFWGFKNTTPVSACDSGVTG